MHTNCKIVFFGFSVVLSLVFQHCGDGSNALLFPEDRNRFLGTWAGSYACPGETAVPDTLTILPGTDALDFAITMHVGTASVCEVTGRLTAVDEISIPEQPFGSGFAKARITLNGDFLTYEQTVDGTTCSGSAYGRV